MDSGADDRRRAGLVRAESRAAQALGNANEARTPKSRERWEAVAQYWLDRANDIRLRCGGES